MDYYNVMRQRGDVMRTIDLIEAGVTRHRVAQLLKSRKLMRPIRGWVALPEADPSVVFAARHGVMLSCMTVARRAGLWSTYDDGLHVAVRTSNAHPSISDCVTHWSRPLIPRPPHVLVDCIENALGYVARCQPRAEAHAVWESALRKALVTRESMARLPLNRAARELLDACTSFSDSGLESFVSRRLRGLRLHFTSQAWLYGHHVDFLIERWLVIQLDGGHHEGVQRAKDNKHDALLELHGYAVIRVTYRQVMFEWDEVQHQIMFRLAQGRPSR